MSIFYFLLISIPIVFALFQYYFWRQSKVSSTQIMDAWREDLLNETYGPLTRSDAIAILNDKLWSLRPVQLLQRLTVFGPLLGVIITGTGFILLSDSSDFKIDELSKVFPIFYGVLLGAILSIWNQIVVVYSENIIAEEIDLFVRNTDNTLFYRSDSAVDSVAEAAVEASEELAKTTGDLVEQTRILVRFNVTLMDESQKAVTTLCESCTETAKSLDSTDVLSHLQKFNHLIEDFTIAMEQGTDVVEERVQESYNQVINESKQFSKRIENTTHTFEKFFSNQVDAINNALNPLEQAASQLTIFTQNALEYSKSLETGTVNVEKQSSAVRELHVVSTSLNKVVARLEKGSMVPLEKSLKNLNETTGDFRTMVSETHSVMKNLNANVSKTTGGVTSMEKYIQGTSDSLNKVEQTVKSLNTTINDFVKVIDHMNKSLPKSLWDKIFGK